MMTEEIEDGELNSDLEDNDTEIFSDKSPVMQFQQATNSNTIRSPMHESDDSKDSNPYDQEDEMILQLKIKALQSLLETQPQAVAKSNKKKLNKSPKKKSTTAFRAQNLKQQDFKTRSVTAAFNNHSMSYNKNQRFKSKKLKKLQKKFNHSNKRPSTSSYSNIHIDEHINFHQPFQEDNYDVQDMDIETASQTNLPQISPLPYLTNLNNGQSAMNNMLNYLSQNFGQVAPSLIQDTNNFNFFNQNQNLYDLAPQINHLEKFYQLMRLAAQSGQLAAHQDFSIDNNLSRLNLLPSQTYNQMSTRFTATNNESINLRNSDSPQPQTLTLEQQQNELNDLIEAQFQEQREQEQRERRNHQTNNLDSSINLNLIDLSANDFQSQRKQRKFRSSKNSLIEIDLTNSENEKVKSSSPVVFTLSSPNNSPTEKVYEDVDERFMDAPTSQLDIDYRRKHPEDSQLSSEDNVQQPITKEVDEILKKLNKRIVKTDVDNHEKEKILKANLLRKLLKIKTIEIEEENKNKEDEEEKEFNEMVEKEKNEVKVKLEKEKNENEKKLNQEDTEEEMNQLRTKLLANLNKKRQEQRINQQVQQDKQEQQMDKDMSLLKRKLLEHELMIVEKEPTLKKTINQKSINNNGNKVNSKKLPEYRKIKPVIIKFESNELR